MLALNGAANSRAKRRGEAVSCIVRLGVLSLAKPWQPATDLCAVLTVLGAELKAETALLVKDNEQVKTDRDAECIDDQIRSWEQNSPAEKHREHADVDGIARVAVRSADDQLLWRIDRRWCATPERGEFPHAPSIDGAAGH